ncbi:hypothetical protein H2198_006524 [Neophaeococcomyces mojaviensis]|uniref:Uncharacterized protein n=1 Tax=Neophaeococcomyces mojaviensis TaxID=3383035 RepID=A0ACC3A2L6_9EURO|nr:hypothetical protein H2198_006524 [Knufia sp. JES_112]
MASIIVPDYEVKALLKPSEVLKSNNKLKDEVSSAFSIEPGTKKMKIQFLDTKQQHIYEKGWNLRIRKLEDDDEFELTYKKRYLVGDGYSSNTEGNIKAASKTAEQDGFDSTTNYEAQVELGYKKQTLSISRDEDVDTDPEGMNLPPVEESRKLLIKKAPKKFKNWSRDNWGTDHLADSIVYGPVDAKRTEGTWEGFGVFVEVWFIKKSKTDASLEPIVEVSFKTPDLKKALEGHVKLVEYLQNKGWLLPEDSFRTRLILERYG